MTPQQIAHRANVIAAFVRMHHVKAIIRDDGSVEIHSPIAFSDEIEIEIAHTMRDARAILGY